MKIIFLDIDGVLNNANVRAPKIDRELVALLNQILDAHPDAQIVISSSWRFMINRGWFTLTGFEFLLQSHGVNAYGRVTGATPVQITDRSRAIREYIKPYPDAVWIALDDEALSLGQNQDRAYHLDGRVGLTDKAVQWSIQKLAGV